MTTDKIKAWAPWESIEESARQQLRNAAALPWVWKHIAVMPDVHFGIGATVGSVIAMRGALAPAAVGVDIGCGMMATRLELRADDVRERARVIRRSIEREIPVGFNSHDKRDGGSCEARIVSDELRRRIADLLADAPPGTPGKARAQIGSLGGGNHFIEVCTDEADGVWLFLHSGSRGPGNVLATSHIARARKLAHNQALPDPDLAVFLSGTPEMESYRRALFWAQGYARLNREAMTHLALRALGLDPRLDRETVSCHHNYVAEEVHFGEDVIVTRKGAIRAGAGELGLIPGSMGTRSYVVRGRGNPDSFESASHGAGRRMSRGKAKKTFTLADLASQTEGVECRKDADVLDEIPGAYKDIDVVMAQQADLVEIVHTLKQVICVKG